MNNYRIALSAGDSVGKELITQARKIFRALEDGSDVRFELFEFQSCSTAIQQYGTALRREDLDELKTCRAILFGNLGNAVTNLEHPELSPVYALTAIRRLYQVYTNIRPVRIRPEYESLSPLKERITRKGMDILLVRDLMGGMISGDKHRQAGIHGSEASDLEYYNEQIVQKSAVFAFEAAMQRRKKITSVDKANVLSSSQLWRETVKTVSALYPSISLEHDFVDHAAMELLINPSKYDIILTSNVFGDILADEIAEISGAPWLFGSGELAIGGRGIYTPNQLHHPRGEELYGKNIVSPYGILDAVSLLLRYSCREKELADRVDAAVNAAITRRLFTNEELPDGAESIGTNELGDWIASNL